MSSRLPRRSPGLIGRGFSLRPRYDLVDHVVAEPARREERVDLALALGRFERFPATELTRDRPARPVALAFSGHIAEGRLDRFAGHAFAGELAHEGAIAFRTETR